VEEDNKQNKFRQTRNTKVTSYKCTWYSKSQQHPVWVQGLRTDPLRLLAGCRNRRLNQAPLNLRGLIWLLMIDWSERGNIRKSGNPSARTQLFAAGRWTSHGSKKEETLRRPTEAPEETRKSECCPTGWWELEAPTVAHRALGLMLILGVAVAQQDRCHLVGHLKMPRARWSVLSRNRKKYHITVRDLLRFLTSSRRFS